MIFMLLRTLECTNASFCKAYYKFLDDDDDDGIPETDQMKSKSDNVS